MELHPDLAFDTDGRPWRLPWKPVSPASAAAFAVGCLFLFWQLATDSDGYLLGLDDLNLAFHEAGHPIFGILGRTLELYGGTLGQLFFPLATCISFYARREPVGTAVTGVWFFENWLNIARYMADARAQLLPLVGGGEHDWFHIFSRWRVLSHDTQIAGLVRALGWMGMGALFAWVLLRAWKDRGEEAGQRLRR